VAVTVRNDREGLRELIPALLAQTRAPDEIVIVDGGSVDGTPDVLSEFDLSGVEVRLIVRPGANIAAGRNAAVEVSSNDRIALTDAGCRPEPAWLEALDRALDRADLVGGIFITDAQTQFEQVVALTHYPVREELEQPTRLVHWSHRLFGRQYLPYHAGGRSMAFTRDTWEAIGGFPEVQYAGEEQAFARAVRERGFKTAFEPAAVVHWRPPGTWTANAQMFYRYCRGDVRSRGRSRHLARAAVWAFSPLAFLRGGWATRALIAAGAASYIALPLRRARRAGLPPSNMLQIPLVVALKDLSQIAGAMHGALDELRGMPQPTPQPAAGTTAAAVDRLARDAQLK
jgi:glycosyltransferase involved in cell wall biosynthesis